MALVFNNIPITLDGGIDQKIDDRLRPGGKLTTVKNGFQDRFGSITKRQGNQLLGQTAVLTGSVSGSLPAMIQLHPYNKSVFGVPGERNYMYGYSEANDVWIRTGGKLSPCTLTAQNIADDDVNLLFPSVAIAGNHIVYSWLKTNADLLGASDPYFAIGIPYWMAVDKTSGVIVAPPQPLKGYRQSQTVAGDGWCIAPKSIAISSSVIITFKTYDGPVISGSVIDCSGRIPYVTTSGFLSSGSYPDITGFHYDIAASTSSLYVASTAENAGAQRIIVNKINPTTLANDSVAYVTSSVPTTKFNHIALAFGSGTPAFTAGTLWLQSSYLNTAGTANYLSLRPLSGFDLTFRSGDLLVLNAEPSTSGYYATGSIGVAPVTVGGLVAPLADTVISVFQQDIVSYSGYLTDNCFSTFIATLNGSTTAVSGAIRRAHNARLLTKPSYTTGTSGLRAFAGAAPSDREQNGFALVDLEVDNSQLSGTLPLIGTALQRQMPYTADQISGWTKDFLPPIVTLGNDLQGTIVNRSETGGYSGRFGISSINLDFSPNGPGRGSIMADTLHMPGGVPSLFDKVGTSEIGFLSYPNILVVSSLPSPTSSLAAGTYQYCFVWETVDAVGNVHQSAPSIQQSTTIPAGYQVDIVALTLPFTNHRKVHGVVYRSEVNGTILYRRTPQSSPQELINNSNQTYMVYSDILGDSYVSGGLNTYPPLYTVGGILANFNPPSSKYSTTWGDRLWLAGCDDPKVVWYSKPRVEGEALSFNDTFQIRFDEDDDITGIAPMDNKLIVFKQNSIWYIEGDGPNAAGIGSFTEPQRIPSTVGCTNDKSIVIVPEGIMFQNDIGIYLLDRGLGITYVGYPVVDTLKAYPTITSAVSHPELTQVRFSCGSGSLYPAVNFLPGATLVWDYLTKTWTTSEITGPRDNNILTGSMVSSAVVSNGRYYSSLISGLRSGSIGAVLKETVGAYSGSHYDAGTYVRMTVETPWMATAGIEGFQRLQRIFSMWDMLDPCTVTVSIATDFSPTYTQVATFNTANLQSLLLQEVNIHIQNQKCTSFRVKIEDTTGTGVSSVTGQGIKLQRITAKVGQKVGLNKRPPKAII